MNYQQLREALVARLQEQITGYAIQAVPENLVYDLKHPNGAILVRYAGSSLGEPTGRMQPKDVEFHLHYFSRNFYGERGIEAMLQQGQMVLSGWQIKQVGVGYVTGERMLNFAEGVWQFGQEYVIRTHAILGARA